jgi:hypothetical protein
MKIPKSLSIERKRLVWEYHNQFLTNHEIAERVNAHYKDNPEAKHIVLNTNAVSKILNRLNKSFQASLKTGIEEIKVEQVAKLLHLAREAYQAWERSKLSSKNVKKKAILKNNENGKTTTLPTEKTTQAKDQGGNPRYLAEVRKCLEDIRRIVGADAPLKFKLSGDSDSDAIKLETTFEGFMGKLARLAEQNGTNPRTESVPE